MGEKSSKVRKPYPLAGWQLESICNELNGGLYMDKKRVLWWLCPDGTSMAIGRQTEHIKFFFTLSCGRHHHLRTTNAVSSADKLLCPWCEPAGRLKGARMRLPTEIEREMQAAFEQLGVAGLCVRETKLPFWHGQVDFWFPAARLIVQADGPRHFAAEPRVKVEQRQATRDLTMCKQACAARVGVVRVHHLQVGSGVAAEDVRRALQLRAQTPDAPVLILSAGFAPAPGVCIKGQRDAGTFITALETALGTSHSIMPNGSVLFYS